SGSPGDRTPRRVWVNKRRLSEDHVAEVVARESGDSTCLVSSGRCLPCNEIRIVSPAGQDLLDGHIGEIVIRSNTLFGGYFNRPDLTAKVLKNSWYWSGDLGFFLESELYVIGRKNDLIIVA